MRDWWLRNEELRTRLGLLALAGVTAYVVITLFNGSQPALPAARHEKEPTVTGARGTDGHYLPGATWQEGGRRWVSLGGGQWQPTQ